MQQDSGTLAHVAARAREADGAAPPGGAEIEAHPNAPPAGSGIRIAPVLDRRSAVALQRAAGNTAVVRLLARQALPRDDCQAGVEQAVDAALRMIDAATTLLTRWEAVAGRAGAATAPPEVARVGRVLGQILHTSDAAYTQVVRLRLGEIARQMREGLVTVNCTSLPASAIGRPTGSRVGGRPAPPGARRDSLAGGVIVGGTTSERTAVGIAGLGMAGGHPSANAETLIHEYAHAVLPAVGVRHRQRTGPVEVHDWAYHHERAYAVLTPEEALNNADTYGQLAQALATGNELLLAAADDYRGFRAGTEAPVRRAVAFAEQRIRMTRGFLFELGEPGAPAPNLELAQRHLGAGDRARLTTFARALGTVADGLQSQLSVRFASAPVRGALAWSSTATITADGVVAGGRGAGQVNVGSAFLGLDPEQQIRVLEQLLVANHADLRARAPAIAALSAELTAAVLPAPAAHGAADHMTAETTRAQEEQRRTAARERLLVPLRRNDGTALFVALNGLSDADRAALEFDPVLIDELRRGLPAISRFVVRMRLHYGSTLPAPARALDQALHDHDADRVRTALQSDRTLSELPGLRDAVEAQLPASRTRDVILGWLPAPPAAPAAAAP